VRRPVVNDLYSSDCSPSSPPSSTAWRRKRIDRSTVSSRGLWSVRDGRAGRRARVVFRRDNQPIPSDSLTRIIHEYAFLRRALPLTLSLSPVSPEGERASKWIPLPRRGKRSGEGCACVTDNPR